MAFVHRGRVKGGMTARRTNRDGNVVPVFIDIRAQTVTILRTTAAHITPCGLIPVSPFFQVQQEIAFFSVYLNGMCAVVVHSRL